MKKPIIATKLVGILVSAEPWEKAHILWFKDYSKKLDRPDIADWGKIYTQKKDYFVKIDEIMQMSYPKLNDEERTTKARDLYFKYVLKYIDEHSDVINQEFLEVFSKLKDKFDIALISTSSKDIIDKLLKTADLNDFFDYIEVADIANKDKKDIVFSHFVKRYGEPVLFVEKPEDIEKLYSLLKIV